MTVATGFAVCHDGVIDVRTVGPTRRAAIVNWLWVVPDVRALEYWTDQIIEDAWDRNRNRYPGTDVYHVTIVKTGLAAKP